MVVLMEPQCLMCGPLTDSTQARKIDQLETRTKWKVYFIVFDGCSCKYKFCVLGSIYGFK